MARIGTNMSVAVESTITTAYTNISAITKADPGEVTTGAAHGLSTGDVLKFAVSAGMVELDGQVVRITTTATDTFELESLDTTDYSTFTAGSYQEIHGMANAG